MTDHETLLETLRESVSLHERNATVKLLDRALSLALPQETLARTLLQGLDDVRHRLMSNRASLPDFLLCLDSVMEGLGTLNISSEDEHTEKNTTIVIGVVEGDPHDLGKNVIAGIYRAYGYRVIDLGRQVPKDAFVTAVLENRGNLLALSAMMSTTMVFMQDIIYEIKVKSPGTAVIVGGAPLDEVLARSFGADGYAESAVTVIEKTKDLLSRS